MKQTSMAGVLPPPLASKFNYFGEYVVLNSPGKLLPHQIDALQSLQAWFNINPLQTALTAMPTGSGKTGVICCLPYFLGALKINPYEYRFVINKPILVISPNLEIAIQLERQILISSDDPEANFISSRRGILPRNRPDALPKGVKIEQTNELNNPFYLQTNDIIIANAQKFLSGQWEVALRDDLFSMVIVDEAHHFPAPTWLRIINKFSGRALIAFFTATPFRTDQQPVVSVPLAYRLTLEDARRRGIIRPTTWVELPFEPTIVYSRLELSATVFIPILDRVRALQDLKNANQPLPNNIPHMAIAIAKDTMEANQVEQLWNTRWGDASAIAYHSQVGAFELQNRMQRLKNNQVKLVVVVDMLKEGFDHPPISIAVILTKIVSPVKFTQFVGRAQRIVRTLLGSEVNVIFADVVTHAYFQQGDNYCKFESEELIEINCNFNQQ